MGRRGQWMVSAGACALAACSTFDRDPLPPAGEALVVVDTDLPVPRVASRLRIDVYTEAGTWLATRDDVRPDPRDWPTSFSVFTDDASRPHVVLVRLRAYLDARLVPYRGAARVAEGPTPDTEPDPSLAVDRVSRITLVHGTRGRVDVTLRGACAGVPARVALPGDVQSCADEGSELAPVRDAVLDPDLDAVVPTAAGSFGLEACTGLEVPDGRVCVPGGAFVLGDVFHRPTDSGDRRPVDARPERVVRLSRFLLDRDEVTVARYRDALARGFDPPTGVTATERDGAPGTDPVDACTWSAAPRGREAYPLSCATWDTARAFCRFEGGDLPSEAQWEYAALAAGRASKSAYPWGSEPVTCERAVFGRTPAFGSDECIELGEGLQPVGAPGAGSPDVNILGIRDLAGSLAELVRDDHAPLGAPCWTNTPPVDPECVIAPSRECAADPKSDACRAAGGIAKGVRGGSWLSRAIDLHPVDRDDSVTLSSTDSLTGFRCVYSAP